MFRKGKGETFGHKYCILNGCPPPLQNWVMVAHIWVESKYRVLCVTTGNELPAHRDHAHVYFGLRLPPYLLSISLQLWCFRPPEPPLNSLHFYLLFLTLLSLTKLHFTFYFGSGLRQVQASNPFDTIIWFQNKHPAVILLCSAASAVAKQTLHLLCCPLLSALSPSLTHSWISVVRGFNIPPNSHTLVSVLSPWQNMETGWTRSTTHSRVMTA